MRAYRHTLRRHRILLLAPIVVVTAIAAWFTFGAAPAYRSSTDLWIDNGTSVAAALGEATQSAAGTGAPAGPAEFEREVVDELLANPSFDVAVARRSLLPEFIQSGRTAGGFSPSVLLARATGGIPPDPLAAAAESVGTNISASTAGPQVLLLSYAGPSPVVARSVLSSLISQLDVAAATYGANIGKTAGGYYRRRLATAHWAVTNTQGALASYVHEHPSANAGDDATYRALVREVQLANELMTAAETGVSEASVEAQAGGRAATIKPMDPPTLASEPVTGLGTKLIGVLGGVVAGIVMSLLALIALTPRATTEWDAELPWFERAARWTLKPVEDGR